MNSAEFICFFQYKSLFLLAYSVFSFARTSIMVTPYSDKINCKLLIVSEFMLTVRNQRNALFDNYPRNSHFALRTPKFELRFA